ncbi:MAG: tryptophan synthase subunit alpha [Spirochaetaceae bacterium]|jgi:tryptophan synthase alpha chain|nr:tryptophan synthase subunit alpha [Spirochaetaceae bacterium]
MSRIAVAFGKEKLFIGFVTGGDPSIEKSEEFILKMIEAGAGLVEIGVPFSDPIAEGPVIQAANIRALKSGASLEKLFALVKSLREKTQVPLVFLTYFNPVFKYGVDNFFKHCAETELDGVIIPDLPFEESWEARGAADKNSVDLISLVAPTSEDRVKEIAKNAGGFLYVVSSMGVTGERDAIETDLNSIITTARAHTNIPIAVGFGINTPEQAADIARVADGVIVGSAIVKIVEQHGGGAGPHIYDYVKSMKAGMSRNQ